MTETLTFSGRALGALVEAGLVTSEQMAAAGEAAGGDGAATAKTLVDRGLVDDEQVAELLEHQLSMVRVDLESYVPDVDALALVPVETAREYGVLPLFVIEGIVTVAITEPTEVFALDALRMELGIEIEPVLADPEQLSSAVERHYAELATKRDAEVEEADTPPPAPIAEFDDQAVGAEREGDSGVLEPSVDAPDAVDPDTHHLGALRDIFLELGAEQESRATAAPGGATSERLGKAPDAAAATGEESAAGSGPAPEPPPIEMASNVADVDRDTPGEGLADTVEAGEPPDEVHVSRGIDLDVLAVADERRVAVLVSDILDLAVERGASHIHVLPYKGDFFVAFRVGGRLETIASAPLSMQRPLVEGFKHFARVAAVSPSLPAVGRVTTQISGCERTLVLSSVPTLAGQRLVISLVGTAEPPTLFQLGLNEAEERALAAMAEQGSGLLLIAGPVSGGRSTSYYAVLAAAAAAGRTVYSIERRVEHEIPAAAQVLVNPGSTADSAAYLAAGMGQDTDVIGIDDIQTVEDAHRAVEAAGIGKLVVATFAGANVARAIRRLLGLGAEPSSLAHALTLVVAQRLVRTNCPHCAVPDADDAAAGIPGAGEDVAAMRSSGCDACDGTGLGLPTAIFEMLPITESVRAAVERGATSAQLEATALSAGMRPFVASGLDKVAAGAVSVDELDRVLRFSEAS